MKNEYGRSMIEMLGVLAIIGVLSIGGLAGYTMAMNRHRANQIMDYVSRCAVLHQTRGYGLDADMTATTCAALMDSETAPVAGTYTVSGATNGRFTITTPTLDTRVAEAIVNRSSTAAANGAPTMTQSSGVVTFTFNPNNAGS